MRVLANLILGAGLGAALSISRDPTPEVIQHSVLHPNGSTVSVFETRARTSADRRSVFWYDSSSWQYDMCGDSTFLGKTGASSPAISDCEAIAALHDQGKKKGYYTAHDFDDPGAFQGLFSSGTCNFGVRPGSIQVWAWYVGTQDVQDLVRDSIAKFGKDGKVGAEGDMSCKKGESVMDVHWGIYGY